MASERIETPRQLGESTPPQYPMADYSFTLQAIMELQKTVGGLTEAVNTLKSQFEQHSKKLDSISHRIYAAGVIVVLATSVIVWLLNLFAPSIRGAIHVGLPK